MSISSYHYILFNYTFKTILPLSVLMFYFVYNLVWLVDQLQQPCMRELHRCVWKTLPLISISYINRKRKGSLGIIDGWQWHTYLHTQVVCPFMLDQFYYAKRMFWHGVAPEHLKRNQLVPHEDDDVREQLLLSTRDKSSKTFSCILIQWTETKKNEISKRVKLSFGLWAKRKILL